MYLDQQTKLIFLFPTQKKMPIRLCQWFYWSLNNGRASPLIASRGTLVSPASALQSLFILFPLTFFACSQYHSVTLAHRDMPGLLNFPPTLQAEFTPLSAFSPCAASLHRSSMCLVPTALSQYWSEHDTPAGDARNPFRNLPDRTISFSSFFFVPSVRLVESSTTCLAVRTLSVVISSSVPPLRIHFRSSRVPRL